ncbi:hypothetical protein V6V89_39730 [Micromonospora sp. CPCC 206061]
MGSGRKSFPVVVADRRQFAALDITSSPCLGRRGRVARGRLTVDIRSETQDGGYRAAVGHPYGRYGVHPPTSAQRRHGRAVEVLGLLEDVNDPDKRSGVCDPAWRIGGQERRIDTSVVGRPAYLTWIVLVRPVPCSVR